MRRLPLSGIHLILRRLLQLAGVVVGIATVNFFLLRFAPGDAVQVIASEAGSASLEYVEALRRQFGLDQPLWWQYLNYMSGLVRLDLGYSFRHSMPVATLILDRLPATLLLMTTSVLLAVLAGGFLGILAAYRPGRWQDVLISVVALLCFATPLFLIGLALVVGFSVWLDWLPVGGMFDIAIQAQGWARVLDVARHLILPALTLALFYMAVYVRLMRASVMEVRRQDYVRTAISRGNGPVRVLLVHVLRNAALPLVTMLGVQMGSIIGGAVVVETVFSWPGLGRLSFDALVQRELTLLVGVLLCSSILVVLVNWLVDFTYAVLDPRIRSSRS